MASKLDELIARLSATQNAYTPLTQEEMSRQANQRYQSLYDQKRLDARQSYETQDAALARQLESLADSYDRQRDQSAKDYQAAQLQADRQALSRGMQRSSYLGATLGNIRLAGNQAQQALRKEQTEKEEDIGRQRGLLSSQLTQRLKQLNEGQQSDVLAYLDELEAREYDRGVEMRKTQNELSMKLYEYQHQLEKEAAEAARWQAEFNAKYVPKASSRGGGGGGGRAGSAGKGTRA